MLGPHRIVEAHPAQDFRREAGNAGDAERLALGQRIADAQGAVIGDADDVAGEGLLRQLALAGDEEHGIVDRDLLAAAHLRQLHAAPEAAGAEAQEGDPVAVVRVHVRLDLEDEAGDLVGSAGSMAWGLAGCGRGERREFAPARSSSALTPKVRSALPKRTGVICPSR